MNVKKLWEDRKRWCGMPITFTRYYFTDDRLFRRKGLLHETEDQVNLYHIRDMKVEVSLWQRLCRVGTVTIISADKTDNILKLENIRKPYEVREALYQAVEDACRAKGMRYTEFTNGAGDGCDHDGDGIADDLE